MEILGFAAALLIGVSLGLIGGGGSILTVPVLVYLLGINPVLATAYSLFVVGFSSLFGAFNKFKKGLVDFKVAALFAPPSFLAVYLTRLYIIPAIPDSFSIAGWMLTKESFLMLLFALIMLLAAWAMLKSPGQKLQPKDAEKSIPFPLIILEGLVVGVITGLVGAGGGFLIIPALVLLAKIPMKKAVGTSLLIIAVKSLVGFIGDVQNAAAINWTFLLGFTFLAIAGIFIGGYISKFVSAKGLKKGFAFFVLIMAFVIVALELI